MRWLVIAALVLVAVLGIWWRQRRSAYLSPRGDPGAAGWGDDELLSELLEAGSLWEAALLCDDGSGRPYRQGLRRVLALGPPEATAAACHLGLGDPYTAEQVLATLPPDHADACEVRSRLYLARGDRYRAHAAMWAAAEGSTGVPRSRRAALARPLHRRARRRGLG